MTPARKASLIRTSGTLPGDFSPGGRCEEEPPPAGICARRRTWHIDGCFVPAAWASRVSSADVVDGRAWRTRSDHSPVVVEWTDPRDDRFAVEQARCRRANGGNARYRQARSVRSTTSATASRQASSSSRVGARS